MADQALTGGPPADIVPFGPTALPFVNLSKWVGEEPPEREWLIKNLIPYGCVTALYGDGGSGKTMLAMELMAAMASRYSSLWLGEKALGFRSVGLFAEDDAHEIIRRLQRICTARGIEFGSVADYIDALPGVGIDVTLAGYANGTGDLVTTPLMEALLTRVRERGAHLLVLDYAAAVFGGNELDRQQVSDFMRRLNSLARDYDIAILLLGHPSMEGMKGGRGTSGSTAWRNQARSFLHLTVDEDQEEREGQTRLTLTHTKSNYSRAGRAFKLAATALGLELIEAAESSPQKGSPPRMTSAQAVCLKALTKAIEAAGEPSPGGPIPSGVRVVRIELWREYAYAAGVSGSDDPAARRRAFYDTRKALQAKGLIDEHDPFAWLSVRA